MIPPHPAPSSPPPLIIRYNEAPPGAGKSRFLWSMMATRPGRYLYAAPHLRLIAEAEAAIRAFAGAAGRDPVVLTITSESLRGRARSVRHEIAAAARDVVSHAHAVVLVTHEGLMGSDVSRFADWTCCIDEVPHVGTSGAMRLPALWPWMATAYRLHPIPETGGWSEVRGNGDALAPDDLRHDSFLAGLSDFHRFAVGRRALFADIAAWEDLRGGRTMAWWSMWDPDNLRPFHAVYLAANGFLGSLTHQLWTAWDGGENAVRFEPFHLPPQPPRVARPATVHFFAEDPASSHWWKETPEGYDAIERIVGWLRANAPSGESGLLWTANAILRERMASLGLQGVSERPLLAGLNAYRHIHWTAAIYSAKLLPDEKHALRLFQIDRELVRRSREMEALVQFAGRGAGRDPLSAEPEHVVVYDRAQAEYVAEHLRRHRLADPIEVRFENVGITRKETKTMARGASALPPPAKADHERKLARERKRLQRAREREAKAATGTRTGAGLSAAADTARTTGRSEGSRNPLQ